MKARAGVATAVLLVLVGTGLALAQRGGFGGFDMPLGARVQTTMPGGYWYRGQPAWSHGYPTSENNLMQILESLTSVTAHRSTNTLSLEDPEI